MRYLAIDHGQKRTGLAICDASETLVTPHAVIVTSSQSELTRRILAVIKDEMIDAIVLGLPLNMDGTEGPRAKQVRKFGSILQQQATCPTFFHDERLSSYEADCLSSEMDLTRKKKKNRLDAIAAASILRSFIEHKNLPENGK